MTNRGQDLAVAELSHHYSHSLEGQVVETERNRVCPVELANSLDSRVRRWLQNPRKILAPYVTPGMTTLDVGCGPGFFSVELARLVGPRGRVIAADLQQGMLEKLAHRIEGTEVAARMHLVKCEQSNINISETVDFVLTFYMVHEVPDKLSLFRQLYAIVRTEGRLLIVEPKLFHVSQTEFDATIRIAQDAGFRSSQGPKLLFSWSAVLWKPTEGAA
jgi:ubiquinone/menaquinone biosynthesis C-methylase UbiE